MDVWMYVCKCLIICIYIQQALLEALRIQVLQMLQVQVQTVEPRVEAVEAGTFAIVKQVKYALLY